MNLTETADQAKTILTDLIQEFVLRPEQIEVRTAVAGHAAFLTVQANPSDVRRIIGAKGAHFRALKEICKAITSKTGHSVMLNHLPFEESQPDRYPKFKLNRNWPVQKISDLLQRAAKACLLNDDMVAVEAKDLEDPNSLLTVHVAQEEPSARLEAISAALAIIFNAVGSANGRTLHLEFARTLERQPANIG